MQEQRPPPLPPLTAQMALACYKCFKDEDVHLSRCSQCLRIAYCSREFDDTIYKLDWKMHKPMCKALSEIEKNRDTFVSLPSEPTKDLTFLNNITQERISNMAAFCVRHVQRELTIFERNLISSEPRCMVCTRTDQLIRIEAAMNGTHTSSSPLIPCPQCGLNFCCSSDHWDAARVLHHAPCEEAFDGISQCEMNMQVREDIKFQNFWTGYADKENISRKYLWRPPRVKSSWTALMGTSWENEFRDEMCQSLGIPVWIPAGPSMLRAASDHLTMAMTILYGLEKLNDDDAWTRKDIITVHIIGANVLEVHCGMVFEEILHRLPQVKTLKLVLCGPDVPGNRSAFDYGTCTECTQRGCKRIQEHAVDTYHAYVQRKGSIFERPDLCIAMNSGASQVSRRTWPETFRTLVQRRIPTLFTSFNREEADAEAALLRAAGATLHAALGPEKNPWGTLHVTPSRHKVYGFSAASGWIAGGFR
ncbi:Zinc finger mynd domain-containing protein 17 [Mycena venus]|uniref:Zinc finger mynd domain-containing protein 17 n=1 Tax=Mycena venus TaxID=2733690 RepID=A0A8H7CLI6_9AGAR|nr:Zinc finger mynd domain-containing protein 17 [Mycena venus]